METTFNEKPAITGKGGYRPGAGRPAGQKNILKIKKAILEYTSPQELKNMVERAKKWAKKDPKMLQWYLEQVFGKAKVVERADGPKTVNNIAYFLDRLEQEKIEGPKPDYYVGDIPNGNGTTYTGETTSVRFTTPGQELET